jgi:hypothetical protein
VSLIKHNAPPAHLHAYSTAHHGTSE